MCFWYCLCHSQHSCSWPSLFLAVCSKWTALLMPHTCSSVTSTTLEDTSRTNTHTHVLVFVVYEDCKKEKHWVKGSELRGHMASPHKPPQCFNTKSYSCHYTNLCPCIPHKPVHTHTFRNTTLVSSRWWYECVIGLHNIMKKYRYPISISQRSVIKYILCAAHISLSRSDQSDETFIIFIPASPAGAVSWTKSWK